MNTSKMAIQVEQQIGTEMTATHTTTLDNAQIERKYRYQSHKQMGQQECHMLTSC